MNELLTKSFKYKWQRIGLIIFGLLTILMGIVFLASFLHMLFSPESKITEWGFGKWWKLILLNSISIVLSIWLGIGSVLAQKWARNSLLILSWGWLITTSIKIFTRILEHDIFDWDWSIILTEIVLGPVLPLLFVIFYIQPTVRETCKNIDLKNHWLDRFPLPVTAVGFLLIGAAFYIFVSLPLNNFAVTFFNFDFYGWMGAILQVLEIVLIFFLVSLIFRSYVYSWECVLVFQLFIALSTAVSTYPENGFNLAWNGWKQWLDVGTILIFLIWSRKYFKSPVFRNGR